MTTDYIMNFSPATPPYDFEHHHHQHTREERLPTLKRMFDSIDHHHHQQASVSRSAVEHSQPPSPPDLLHDSEEDDEDSLSTPSLSLSPKQGFLSKDHDLISSKNRSYSHGYVRPMIHQSLHRRKSVPHRSPPVVGDAFQASLLDKSVVFQLNVQHTHTTTESSPTTINNYAANQSCPDCGDTCDLKCTSKVICGQSLLSALRKRVAHARSLHIEDQHTIRMSRRNKRTRTPSIIEIPRQNRRNSSAPDSSSSAAVDSSSPNTNTNQATVVIPEPHRRPWVEESQQLQQHQYHPQPQHHEEDGDYEDDEDHHQVKRVKKPSNAPRRQSSTHGSSSGRPSRVKGPCQACQEASDGCMRKAFNWPFPASQIFNDKGKPFVYLCNKCGLRYNKSGGCVCRNCRWVFCKEEKRKALQHIDAMRRNRPDGHVDPNEDIEHFVCSPKYWTCGRPWKVGWVLNNLEEDDDETDHIVSSPASHNAL